MAADINPASDPQSAFDYMKATLLALKERQGELEAWFGALAQQVAWGIIQCQDVVDYNLRATNLYNAQVDFFSWIQPAMRAIEVQTGMRILTVDEVPLPQLIGTKYTVFDRGGGKKSFDAGVSCNADGTFSASTPQSAIQIDPRTSTSGCGLDGLGGHGMMAVVQPIGPIQWSPHPTISDLRVAGLGDTSPTTWLTLASYALVVIGAAVILHALRSLLSTATGGMVQELNNEAYSQYIRAKAARELQINACYEAKLKAVAGGVDAQTAQEWRKECELANPPVEPPPYGSSWMGGLLGIVVAGGAIWIGVSLLRSRGRTSKSDEG